MCTSTLSTTAEYQQISECLALAGASVGRSFAVYWPAHGVNDACEANLSFHFAHVLLTRQFAVFAEACHPDDDVRGIDLLGIAPARDWFLAAEFKRLFAGTLSSLLNDINRLRRFWLNAGPAVRRCGPAVVRVATECQRGYGLVAGLHWVGSRQRTDILDFWEDQASKDPSTTPEEASQSAQNTRVLWSKPIRVYNYPNGKYVLLGAILPIDRRRL